LCSKHHQAWHHGKLIGVEPDPPRVVLRGAPVVSRLCYWRLSEVAQRGSTVGEVAARVVAETGRLRRRAKRGQEGARPEVRLTGLPHTLPGDLHQQLEALRLPGEPLANLMARVLEGWARE
jgi:hypothetical protein